MVETRGGRRFAFLFLGAAFLVLLFGRWLSPVDNVAMTVAAPFAAAVSGVAGGIGDTVSGIVQGNHYRSVNIALRHDVGILLHQNLVLQEQAHENTMLTRMLRFDTLNNRMDLLPASVIAGDPNSLSPYIVINRGSRDGMRQGMTVVDPNGYFVGTIDKVMNTACKVLLMNSASSDVGAMDQKTRAKGDVEGVFGAVPQFRFVYTSAVLHPGDLVVTSGYANLFPRTILLGQIVSIQRSDVQEFQQAQIQPAADLRNLEMVQVVRNYVPNEPTRLMTP